MGEIGVQVLSAQVGMVLACLRVITKPLISHVKSSIEVHTCVQSIISRMISHFDDFGGFSTYDHIE